MQQTGVNLNEIPDKNYRTVSTSNAENIVKGLNISGIIFSGKYDDTKIVLAFSKSDSERVDEIIERCERSKPEINDYAEIFPEIAICLNTSVSAIESRPNDIKMMLSQIYIDNFYGDQISIKKALAKVIEVNSQTAEEIQKADENKGQKNNSPEKQQSINEGDKMLFHSAEAEQEKQKQQQANEHKRTGYFSMKWIFERKNDPNQNYKQNTQSQEIEKEREV